MGEKTNKEYFIMKESIKIIEHKPKDDDSGTGTVEIKLFPRTCSYGYFALKKLTQKFVDDASGIQQAIPPKSNINSVVILYEREKVSNPIFAFKSVPPNPKDGTQTVPKKLDVIDFKVTLFDVDEDDVFLMQVINAASQVLNRSNKVYFRNVNKTEKASRMTPASTIPVVKEDTINPEI